jgi:hypothetical protein
MKRILADLAGALRFRTVRHGYLAAAVAFVAALVVLMVTWSGWLYPLRPDAIGALGHPFTADPLFDNSWGGPTLAGAWFVHALVAVGIQVVCLAAIRRLAARPGRRPVRAV